MLLFRHLVYTIFVEFDQTKNLISKIRQNSFSGLTTFRQKFLVRSVPTLTKKKEVEEELAELNPEMKIK